MGEVKGAMFSLFLIVAFVLPFYFMLMIQNINVSGFFSITQTMTNIIEENGGVDAEVAGMLANLEKRDINEDLNTYDIKVYKLPGQNSKLEDGKEIYPSLAKSVESTPELAINKYGDVLLVKYDYSYKYMNFVREQSTTHRIVVTKRTARNVTEKEYDDNNLTFLDGRKGKGK